MSEQSKIIHNLQELIMEILKTGTASPEQGAKLDRLEELLHKQKSFQEGNNPKYSCKGEEIAYLFFNSQSKEAIEKLYEYKITPEDFFGFAEYHFDEDEEERLVEERFTQAFQSETQKIFQEYKNSRS